MEIGLILLAALWVGLVVGAIPVCILFLYLILKKPAPDNSFKYCYKENEDISAKFCVKCGSRVDINVKFCPNCGNPFNM